MGSKSAWLPSRRSVESQIGAWAMERDGHRRSGLMTGGNGRYFVWGSVSIGASKWSSVQRGARMQMHERRNSRTPTVLRLETASWSGSGGNQNVAVATTRRANGPRPAGSRPSSKATFGKEIMRRMLSDAVRSSKMVLLRVLEGRFRARPEVRL